MVGNSSRIYIALLGCITLTFMIGCGNVPSDEEIYSSYKFTGTYEISVGPAVQYVNISDDGSPKTKQLVGTEVSKMTFELDDHMVPLPGTKYLQVHSVGTPKIECVGWRPTGEGTFELVFSCPHGLYRYSLELKNDRVTGTKKWHMDSPTGHYTASVEGKKVTSKVLSSPNCYFEIKGQQYSPSPSGAD